MALLGFSVLKDKLLSHEKCQTIRVPRKIPFKLGEKVYIYWHLRQKDCTKLGEGIITSIVRKKFISLTDTDAELDGFTTGPGLTDTALTNLRYALLKLHEATATFQDSEFDIVTWRWD